MQMHIIGSIYDLTSPLGKIAEDKHFFWKENAVLDLEVDFPSCQFLNRLVQIKKHKIICTDSASPSYNSTL